MIEDLTFDFSRSLDFHVQPFVPLAHGNRTVALSPQFPLHSRPEENILRVCSIVKPEIFDAASLGKEPESLAHLKQKCSCHHLQGPVRLPKPLLDIDLLVADEASSTLLIAELKWIRKTARPVEIPARDADVLKGVGQLKQIRQFRSKTLITFANSVSCRGVCQNTQMCITYSWPVITGCGSIRRMASPSQNSRRSPQLFAGTKIFTRQ